MTEVPFEASPLEVSPLEAAAILRAAEPGTVLFLDCRTPEEHATARIDGTVLLPMQELPDRVGELAGWKERRILVHCHHGMRSLRVTQWLREKGFAAVTSMSGGIDAWSADVDPAVPRY